MLQVVVGGIIGFGLQGSSLGTGQAASQAALSTLGDDFLRLLGAKFGFIQNVGSGSAEEALSSTIGGDKGDFFWCSFDFVPFCGDCDKRRAVINKLK